MRKLRIVTILMVGLLSLLLVTACGAKPDKDGDANQEQILNVPIGINLELTGEMAVYGLPALDAVKLAIHEVNENGGFVVGGQKYNFEPLIEDSQGQASNSVAIAQRLIKEKNVKIMVGPGTSVNGAPVVKVTQPAKVIHLGSATLYGELTKDPENKYLFHTNNPFGGPNGLMTVFANWAVNKYPIKKVAFLFRNDDAAKTFSGFYEEEFNKLGVQIIAKEWFQPGATDFSAQLTKIKNAGVDTLVLGYGDSSAIPLVRQARELQVANYYLGTMTTEKPAFESGATPLENYAWPISSRDIINNQDPVVLDYVKRFEEYHKRKITTDAFNGLYFYDYIFMVAKAMENAGTVTDTDKIAQELENMRYQGVLNIRMESNRGHQALYNFEIGYVENGKVNIIVTDSVK